MESCNQWDTISADGYPFVKLLIRSFFYIHDNVRVKDNLREFITEAIASDAAIKETNIILDAFISRNAAKPL